MPIPRFPSSTILSLPSSCDHRWLVDQLAKILSSFKVSHDRTILCNSWSSSLGKQRPTLCMRVDSVGLRGNQAIEKVFV